MVVEVFLRGDSSNIDELPESVLELESLLGEARVSYEKLNESTDLLTEECRRAESEDDAREYYSYVQDNLMILEAKDELIKRIQAKINQIRGVFHKCDDNAESNQDTTNVDIGHFV